MGIIYINVNTTGLVGSQVQPRRCTLVTTDSLSTITTSGYLNNQNQLGNIIFPTDVFEILYDFNESTQSGTFGIFQISYNLSTGFSLNIWENPGNVSLPVVSGDFAVFNGTTGQIKDLGYSPTNASKAKIAMLDSVPVVASNMASFSATNGTLADSGVAISSIQLKNQVKAGITANIGGAGAGPISVSLTGLTTSSIIMVDIATSSNTVSVAKVIAAANSFNVTFSGDPGATCTLNYVAYIASQ